MFTISKINYDKDISNKQTISKQLSDVMVSPPKSEEKSPIFTNSSINFSLQTNISSYSGKGNSINFFTIDQNVLENNQEQIDSNSFLAKKRKFKVNYISNEKKLNDNYKQKPKEKKIKKEDIFSLAEIKGENEGRWNDDEHLKFLEAINIYGNNWREVQKYVKTRSSNQVRSHAQKFILKLKTFKDSSLGIDFTENSIKSLTDIIEKIKEIEKFNNNKNILLLLNQKLSEKNMKNNFISKSDKNKKQIKFKNEIKENNQLNINSNNSNIINKKIDKNISAENSLEKENVNVNINNDENEKIKKNSNCKKLNNKKYINSEEKTNEGGESNNKIEEKNYYFDYEEKYYLNDKYEIINDVIYEINKNDNTIPIQNNYNIKEFNTISIINRGYYC